MEEDRKAELILQAIRKTPPEVTETYQRVIAKMDKGLPVATTAKVLTNHCTI